MDRDRDKRVRRGARSTLLFEDREDEALRERDRPRDIGSWETTCMLISVSSINYEEEEEKKGIGLYNIKAANLSFFSHSPFRSSQDL